MDLWVTRPYSWEEVTNAMHGLPSKAFTVVTSGEATGHARAKRSAPVFSFDVLELTVKKPSRTFTPKPEGTSDPAKVYNWGIRRASMNDEKVSTRYKSVVPTRTTPSEGQIMPPVSDTSLNVTGAPDADYHPVALANAIVDSEAGPIPDPDNDMGGIVPLKRKE
jgi:hypothetical protein